MMRVIGDVLTAGLWPKTWRLFVTGLLLVMSAEAVNADALAGKPTSTEILEQSTSEDWRRLDPGSLLVIELARGRVTVALSSTLAQGHVAQIKTLASEGFYDGLSFYRVIEGFVAQGGDLFEGREIKTASKTMKAAFDEKVGGAFPFDALPDVDGYAPQSGFSESLPTGFDPGAGRAWHLHCTGALAFGRETDRDTESTEFYITLQPQRYLDRNLTVAGYVVDGMEYIQALRRVEPAPTPEGDLGETILSMRVASDLPLEERPDFEMLRTDTETFEAYTESRRNRPEGFFYVRPGHIDICALKPPVRSVESE